MFDVDASTLFATVRVHGLINGICAFEQERSREDWEHLRRSIGQKLRRIREAHVRKPEPSVEPEMIYDLAAALAQDWEAIAGDFRRAAYSLSSVLR